MADTIWDILGIPPTSDKRAIKKAYAAKCAACHPEEHPEEFDRLHKAYTAAVKAAARIPAGTPTMASANERTAIPEDTHTTAPASEQAAVPAVTHTTAPASERTALPADIHITAPASEQAAIPDISLLVEQGMEQELNASCSKLLESLNKLHDSFPKSVDTNGEDFTKALLRLEEWYESPRFKLAGWEPDFLKQLDQWLSANRDKINRAEAVALYRAYRFRQYKSPSYPVIPYMDNVHWEIMQHAYRYEKDMAPSRTSNPSDAQKIINEIKKNPPPDPARP